MTHRKRQVVKDSEDEDNAQSRTATLMARKRQEMT